MSFLYKARRFLLFLLGGTLVAFLILLVGLQFYDDGGNAPPSPQLQAVEVEYLTPEEAARLLGGDPDDYRLPTMLSAPPPPPETDEAAAKQ